MKRPFDKRPYSMMREFGSFHRMTILRFITTNAGVSLKTCVAKVVFLLNDPFGETTLQYVAGFWVISSKIDSLY